MAALVGAGRAAVDPATGAGKRRLRRTMRGQCGIMEEERRPATGERRGEHNELGYRNVDEEAQHDERGSQGPERDENPDDDDERSAG
jgi:hypothetical protein